MTQPLAWPFLTALAELRQLEETATHGNQLDRRIWLIFFAHSSIVTIAMVQIDVVWSYALPGVECRQSIHYAQGGGLRGKSQRGGCGCLGDQISLL
jgi:hypothetical protein